MGRTTVHCKFRKARGKRTAQDRAGPQAHAPSRVARMLALAHHIERLIQVGESCSQLATGSERVLGQRLTAT